MPPSASTAKRRGFPDYGHDWPEPVRDLNTRPPVNNSISNWYRKVRGEPAGGRTRDHLIKSQVLYQLSYRLSQSGGT